MYNVTLFMSIAYLIVQPVVYLWGKEVEKITPECQKIFLYLSYFIDVNRKNSI